MLIHSPKKKKQIRNIPHPFKEPVEILGDFFRENTVKTKNNLEKLANITMLT